MSQRPKAPLPAHPFALLLVEGGDEEAACRWVAGAGAWQGIHCWNVQGREKLPSAALLASGDGNFGNARSVGIVMDAEASIAEALLLAQRALAAFGQTGPPVHATFAGTHPKVGVFITPDGAQPGSLESLCRLAVLDPKRANCVDAMFACTGSAVAQVAGADKAWLKAYLATLPAPDLRFYRAFEEPDGLDPNHPRFDHLRAFLRAL